MTHIKEIDQAEFESLASKERTSIVKFTAPWCAACKAIHPAVKMIAEDNQDMDFYEVDADKVPELLETLEIRSLPTFLSVHKGETEKHRVVSALQLKKIVADLRNR